MIIKEGSITGAGAALVFTFTICSKRQPGRVKKAPKKQLGEYCNVICELKVTMLNKKSEQCCNENLLNWHYISLPEIELDESSRIHPARDIYPEETELAGDS